MTGPAIDPLAPYLKNGHTVIDMPALDASGHVPTHRLDQPTNRLPNESWADYQRRVLARRAFSPDTARVSSLSALEPDVADSTRSLMQDATANGISLSPVETRRSQERQEMLFQKGRSAPGDVATWTLTSDHTPGRAVDFDGNAAAQQWLQTHAPAHGFGVMGAMDPGHVSMPAQAAPPRAPDPRGIAPTTLPPVVARAPRTAPTVRLPGAVVMARPPAQPPRTLPTPTQPTPPSPAASIDPLDQLKAMKAQAAPPSPVAASPDPLDQLKAMKAAAPVVGGDPNQKLHDEFKSGNLATRMARENANDAQASAPGVGEQVATHVLNAAQGIPGVRALEAGAGSLGSVFPYMLANGPRPLNYQQSLKTLDSATGNIGGKTSFAEKALGSLAVAPFLPANAVKAGALFAGADRALSADPESLGSRALGTAGNAAVGGAVGGVVGRVAQGATTAVRAGLAQNPADNVLARQAERALSAKRLFSGALNEGQAHGATQAVRDFLAEPDIAARVQALQGLQQFKQTPAESPEMLDALYKSLSDEAKGIQKGLAVADPSKPNTGRFREGNVKALKDNLLGSVEAPGAGGTPPMMPSYRTAVEDFAQKSGDIDALGKGMTASQAATKPTRPTFKNITSKEPKTPQTFAQWAQGATDSQKQAASQGILGDVKNAFHEPGKTLAPFRRATSTAPGLLRSVGDNTVADILQNMGIASTLSPFSK